MTQSPTTTEAGEIAERDAEIARLEAKGHVVLDIYNPRNHLSEHLAPKVALLKAVFGIDDSGRLTRPPPPKAFGQQVFEYIMGGRIRERRARKPPKPRLRTLIERAEAATGKTVTAITTLPDGTTKLNLSTHQDDQQQGNEVDEWIAKHARAPEGH